MSLSSFFKDQGQFVPELLVPRPGRDSDSFRPAAFRDSAQAGAELPPSDAGFEPTAGTSIPGFDPGAGPETLAADEPAAEHRDTPVPAGEGPAQEEQAPPPPPIDIEAVRAEMFQAGVQEGVRQAEADFGSCLSACVQVCDQLNTIRDTILKNSKAEITELVLALAEKIIRHSVTDQDRTIVKTVEEAIQQAVRSSEFSIYLNPDDLAVIKERSQELIAGVNGLEHVIIKADTGIERGGCRVESENCTVDATLSSQLQILSDHVRHES